MDADPRAARWYLAASTVIKKDQSESIKALSRSYDSFIDTSS